MKNVKSNNHRKYFLVFTAVTVLNILLVAFLLNIAFFSHVSGGASQDTQTPAVIVANQPDSPLLIIVTRVDSSISPRPLVSYILQNKGDKAIRGYTIAEREKTSQSENITATTIDYATKLLAPKGYNRDSFADRPYSQTLQELSLSVDYVEFEDGTSWGEDTYKGSETIAGRRAGQVRAVEEIKSLLGRQSPEAMSFLSQEITDVISPAPDPKQSIKWQIGFQNGYKSVLALLQSAYRKSGAAALSAKLEDMAKAIRKEENK